jgi:RES domain-containing protein
VTRAWRLTKTKHLATAWDGEGARRSGGRWNSAGTAVVYTSGSLALALVETLVHLPAGLLPAYTALPIEFDDGLVIALSDADLPRDWRTQPAPASTKALGDRWVADRRSALLRVPSVVVPTEFNYLVNPLHPDAAQVSKGPPMPFPFDPRLR